jgi:hypothetical protein
MSRPTPLTYKIKNWWAYNKELKRRGSLTIWFDPEMTWDAFSTEERAKRYLITIRQNRVTYSQ